MGGEYPQLIVKAAGKSAHSDDVCARVKLKPNELICRRPGAESEQIRIVKAVRDIDGIEVINISDRVFLMHIGGKIEVTSKAPLKTRDDLSMAYTPGVARICEAIHRDPEKAFTLTIKKNTVAVVSDGTAVLGLGDIGPAA